MKSIRAVGDVAHVNPPPVNLRCPACSHMGTFVSVGLMDATWNEPVRNLDGRIRVKVTRAGVRQCPNLQCHAVVFVAAHDGEAWSYPPEVIDFDANNLPPTILSSLQEAIKCHAAGCYRASALMVRRVLEEMCEDKKAAGKNLKERISALSSTAVVPLELLEAADELRLLGNDAAHIEAKTYDTISEQEVEIALELTKELLKAVYQYTSLVAKLRALKRP